MTPSPTSMPNTVIVDLDGTLCDNSHRKYLVEGPKKNFKAFHALCHHDTCHEPVAAVVRAMHVCGYRIALVSGREDFVQHATRFWLEQHHIPYHDLFMRPTGDYRPDHEFKADILHTHLGGPAAIFFALDDRTQVVQMWRRHGILCMQVAEGNF